MQETAREKGGAQRSLPADLVLPGRYHVLAPIGGGLFSSVVRAIDDSERGSTRVAVKYTDLETIPARLRARALALFENEAAMLGKLHHQSIPLLYSYSRAGSRLFLVTEYVAARSLEAYLGHLGRLPLWETLRIGLALCPVLEYLHGLPHPVIHGDINPSNILWRPTAAPEGLITLTDFANARHVCRIPTARLRLAKNSRLGRHSRSVRQWGAQNSMGTRGYAPHEQYGVDRMTRRTDVFAFGATLYHLLTGRHPGEQVPDGLHAFFDLSLLRRPGIPPGLGDLLERTIQDNPRHRPTMAEVGREILVIAKEAERERVVAYEWGRQAVAL